MEDKKLYYYEGQVVELIKLVGNTAFIKYRDGKELDVNSEDLEEVADFAISFTPDYETETSVHDECDLISLNIFNMIYALINSNTPEKIKSLNRVLSYHCPELGGYIEMGLSFTPESEYKRLEDEDEYEEDEI